MTETGTRFGEVAGVYDNVRPGYPDRIATDLAAFHVGALDPVVEVGAGTGLGTALLMALGAPVTCLEPDPRMAALLAVRHPTVTVVDSTFEAWTPPPGGVSVLACAMAWHWLDPDTRNRRALDALRPGGTLAVFSHHYGYADPQHTTAIGDAFRSVERTEQPPLRPDGWFHEDIRGSALFKDLKLEVYGTKLPLSTEDYLRLVRTFGPFRAKSPAAQRSTLDALRETLTRLGGGTVLDLRTTLALARRPFSAAAP